MCISAIIPASRFFLAGNMTTDGKPADGKPFEFVRTWQEVAAELCKEQDPEKSILLAEELNEALEHAARGREIHSRAESA